MKANDKLNALSDLLDGLNKDTDLSKDDIRWYKLQLEKLNEERIASFYDRFIIRQEKSDYESPAVYLYRVLDHM